MALEWRSVQGESPAPRGVKSEQGSPSQQIPKKKHKLRNKALRFPNTLNIDKTKREVLLLRCADTLSVGVLGTELI